jgi:CBS domain-containing protein
MMRVSNIMTTNPVTIRSDASLRQALETMAVIDCHHLPVMSSAGHVVGIVTARECRLALKLPDVLPELWHDHQMVDSLSVRDVMNPNVIVAEPETSTKEVARLMLTQYASCVLVMLGETLVGICTVSDILVAFTTMV